MTLATDANTDTLPKLLKLHAKRTGRRPGMREKDRGVWQTYSWRDCQDHVRSFALGLAALGFRRGDKLSVDQHTLIRLALVHVTSTLHDVANFVYLAGGTTALRRGVIQRLLRDVHAGTQHVTSSPPVVQACGRQLAGLAAGKVWRFLDLVDPD